MKFLAQLLQRRRPKNPLGVLTIFLAMGALFGYYGTLVSGMAQLALYGAMVINTIIVFGGFFLRVNSLSSKFLFPIGI